MFPLATVSSQDHCVGCKHGNFSLHTSIFSSPLKKRKQKKNLHSKNSQTHITGTLQHEAKCIFQPHQPSSKSLLTSPNETRSKASVSFSAIFRKKKCPFQPPKKIETTIFSRYGQIRDFTIK